MIAIFIAAWWKVDRPRQAIAFAPSPHCRGVDLAVEFTLERLKSEVVVS